MEIDPLKMLGSEWNAKNVIVSIRTDANGRCGDLLGVDWTLAEDDAVTRRIGCRLFIRPLRSTDEAIN